MCKLHTANSKPADVDHISVMINPLLSGNAPYFIILLCLKPDNFTRQGESTATQLT
jgi:hypothetical protein